MRLLVFVASPSDTTQERACLRSVIDELNRGIADDRGLVLDLVDWQTHSWPGVGSDIQDVINREIPDPDVLVGIFWKRLGTPTQRAPSGTAEEIERALALKDKGRHVEVLIYFNQAAYTPQQHELKQIGAVLDFRRKLEERGVLVGTYTGVSDFEAKVRQHLMYVARNWPIGDGVATGSARVPARQVQVTPGGSQAWRDQIMAGQLSAEINPPLGGRAYSFVSTVGLALADAGFTAGTCDRVSIILIELLNNVARYAEGAALIEIWIERAGNFRNIEISVASEGPDFDFYRMVEVNIAKLESGDREHGLLRVSRLAGSVNSGDDSFHVGSVHCEIYERERRDSVLRHSPAVLPICFEYGFPWLLWVGEEGYSEESLALLHYGGPAVQSLFFAPLAARDAPWLGIEIVGNVFSSDISPAAFGIETPSALRFPEVPDGGFELVEPAIRSYFHSKFESRQVVVYAHHTDFSVKSAAASWAREHQLPYFDNEPELTAWLPGITPGAGEPG
jgi:anti-sigma regulatory factor (Ser/Thr protein kinase)